MIVMVSVLRSPPCSPVEECIAMSSLSSGNQGVSVNSHIDRTPHGARTCTPIDDSVMGSEYDLEQLCDWPCDDPLPRSGEVSSAVTITLWMRAGANHSPKQHMYDRGHLRTDPKTITCANGLGNDFSEPGGGERQPLRSGSPYLGLTAR